LSPVDTATRTKSTKGTLASLAATYLVFGGFWGSWAVIFSDFLSQRSLTPGQASINFAALSATSILVMTFVAPRFTGISHGSVIAIGLGFHAIGALLIAWVPNGWLALAFASTGLGTGLIDVFVNVAGQDIETRLERPVLQWLHATYSVGAALGAVISALAIEGGADAIDVLIALSVVQFAVAGLAWVQRQPKDSVEGTRERNRTSLGVFVRTPLLLIPAAVVLFSFFIEGSMDVWSVIYLRRTMDATALAGAGGFALFSIAMAVGRGFAARLLFGLGYRRTILFAGFGSMAAGAVAVLTDQPTVASLAFLVLGFCMASAAPAAFGLAGRWGDDAGVIIAAMTTVGYSGFVVGPPILGWLADRAGLRASMLVVVLATLGIAVAGLLSRGDPKSVEPPDRQRA
jgi:MFS family permease